MERLTGLIEGMTILSILIAVAWYIILKLRKPASLRGPSPRELLTRYTEMYESGEISREEFVAIRSIFTAELSETSTRDLEAIQRETERRERQARLAQLMEDQER